MIGASRYSNICLCQQFLPSTIYSRVIYWQWVDQLTKLSSFSWIIHALFLLAPSHLHDAYSTNHKTPSHSHKLVTVYLNILVFVPLKTAEFHLPTWSCENNEINSLNWWKFSVLAPWSALYKQVFHLEIWDFTNCP